MTTTSVSPSSTTTRQRWLALVVAQNGYFRGVSRMAEVAMSRVQGGPRDARQLTEVADGVPVVTDAPERVTALLAEAGLRTPVVWDVVELAALLVPACPRESLDRAASFFGIVVE